MEKKKKMVAPRKKVDGRARSCTEGRMPFLFDDERRPRERKERRATRLVPLHRSRWPADLVFARLQ